MGKTIRALTLWQPWASLVAVGAKKIETRSWYTKHRGSLAIHAAKSFGLEQRAYAYSEPVWPYMKNIWSHGKPIVPYLGTIVAIVTLADCIEMTPEFIAAVPEAERFFGDYQPGRYAWMLTDVRLQISPIPAIGHQGLWKWEVAEGVKI